MTVREHRMRKIMFPENAPVLVCVEGEYVAGTVHTVGWRTGTYRIKVGRRLHHVSLSQVRATSRKES